MSLPGHGWDEKKIYEPTDAEDTQGEEIDRPRDGFAKIERLRAGETNQSEDIAHPDDEGLLLFIHSLTSPGKLSRCTTMWGKGKALLSVPLIFLPMC